MREPRFHRDETTHYRVANTRSKQSAVPSQRVFETVELPHGERMRILDREVHEAALQAVKAYRRQQQD